MKNIQLKRRYRIMILKRLRSRLEKLLNILTLSGLYELYETAIDERLKKRAEQKILKIAAGNDDLLEIIINALEPLRSKAWGRLKSKIQQEQIIKNQARQILKTIIKFVSELRKETWELYKTLDPTDGELKEIQAFDFIYSAPFIAHDIEQLLRGKQKRKKVRTARTIKGILEITRKINELKRGQ